MTRQPDRLDEAFLAVFGYVRLWTSRLFRWGPWVIAALLLYAALEWRKAVEVRIDTYGQRISALEDELLGDTPRLSDELEGWYEEGPAGK